MRPARAIALCLVTAALCALAVAGTAEAWPAGCNGQRALCERPFNLAVLPATHNSMSAASLGFVIPNQPVGIPAQLRDGIRGLLFDTHYGRRMPDGTVATDDNGTGTEGRRGLYLCHELCEIGASPLIGVLRAMRRYVHRHPDNVFLIDNEDHIAPADFVRAMRRSGLARYAYRGATGPQWPTLRSMIARRQQVVVLAEHQAGAAPWYHLDYQGIVQETAYTWPTADLITLPANWPASCAPNRGGTTGSLFLMNHWSPPTPRAVADPVADAQVNAASVLIGRAEACRAARGLMPTIVAVDQFRSGGLFAAVKQLNAEIVAPPVPAPAGR